LNYGVDLRLNTKAKHLSATVAAKKRNFSGKSRVLTPALEKFYTDLTKKG